MHNYLTLTWQLHFRMFTFYLWTAYLLDIWVSTGKFHWIIIDVSIQP